MMNSAIPPPFPPQLLPKTQKPHGNMTKSTYQNKHLSNPRIYHSLKPFNRLTLLSIASLVKEDNNTLPPTILSPIKTPYSIHCYPGHINPTQRKKAFIHPAQTPPHGNFLPSLVRTQHYTETRNQKHIPYPYSSNPFLSFPASHDPTLTYHLPEQKERKKKRKKAETQPQRTPQNPIRIRSPRNKSSSG